MAYALKTYLHTQKKLYTVFSYIEYKDRYIGISNGGIANHFTATSLETILPLPSSSLFQHALAQIVPISKHLDLSRYK